MFLGCPNPRYAFSSFNYQLSSYPVFGAILHIFMRENKHRSQCGCCVRGMNNKPFRVIYSRAMRRQRVPKWSCADTFFWPVPAWKCVPATLVRAQCNFAGACVFLFCHLELFAPMVHGFSSVSAPQLGLLSYVLELLQSALEHLRRLCLAIPDTQMISKLASVSPGGVRVSLTGSTGEASRWLRGSKGWGQPKGVSAHWYLEACKTAGGTVLENGGVTTPLLKKWRGNSLEKRGFLPPCPG